MKRIIKFTVYFLILFCFAQAATAGELTLVTMNAWPAIEYTGLFSCTEYEPENDRLFRQEILTTGLKALDADIIVLNGLNPAGGMAEDIASALGMNALSGVSRSGLRVFSVSLPLNLQEGDAVLVSEDIEIEPADNLYMNGLLGSDSVSLLSRNGVQVMGCRVSVGDVNFYLFSAVWTESLFNDEESLEKLKNEYINKGITAKEYVEYINNAVDGSEKRNKQAVETLSFINSVAGESPVILMGSLNALPGSSELAVLTDAGFIDVFKHAGRGPGYTINTVENSSFSKIPEGNPRAALKLLAGHYRADYIFMRGPGIEPLSAEVVLDKPVYGVYPSNRYGLKAVIEFAPTPSGQ